MNLAALKKISVNTALLLAALAGSLVATEIFLRLSGYIYLAARAPAHGGDGGKRILCLGDSYTLGVGAGLGESYPDELQRLLDARFGSGRYTVINAGVPGHNSSQSARRLAALMKKHSPDILVLLTGINNVTLMDSHFRYFDPANSGPSSAAARWATRVFYSSRLMKLFRLAEESAADQQPLGCETAVCGEPAQNFMLRAEPLSRAGDHLGASALLKKAVEIQPSCLAARLRLALSLYRLKDYAPAFSQAREALHLDPGNRCVKWLLSKELPLTRAKEMAPLLAKLLEYDLALVAGMASAYDSQLVLLSYPWGGGLQPRSYALFFWRPRGPLCRRKVQNHRFMP